MTTIATDLKRGLPTEVAHRVGFLERAGKAAVRRALARLTYGRIELSDRDDAPESFGPGGPDAPTIRVRVTGEGAFAAMAFRGAMGASEAYMDGLWQTDDLPGLIEVLTVNYAPLRSMDRTFAKLAVPFERARYLLRRNTRSGSRRNIVAHYDLSDEFFRLFLDPTMLYSSAYFRRGDETLEEAQTEKIDLVCRKLGLIPTDHLVEIGSGWGAMAIHAARHYGCRVTTTTISDNQFAETARRVNAAGLQGRIEVLKEDYRDLARRRPGAFDKLVSIEMIEAVGHAFHDEFFRGCAALLKPDGLACIQAIVIRDQFYDAAKGRVDFLKRYIFPGSCLMSVGRMQGCVARVTDFTTRHTEDIGPHYIRTLRAWREAFMARLPEVRGLGFDERFIRMWEYYLAYCEGAFRAGHCSDVQLLLAKPLGRPMFIGPGGVPSRRREAPSTS